MSKYQFVQFEFPKSHDGKYTLGLDDAGVFISRRKQLGFTQEQVAKMAGVQLSQYQRFESGERDIANSAMRTGLAICAVLMLDPYEMVGIRVKQHSPKSIKPQEAFDARIPEELLAPKRAGRKQIRRDIMKAFLNYMDNSIVIPYEILDKIGSPDYIQLLWKPDEKRIAIRPATADDEEPIDIPKKKLEQSLLVIPKIVCDDNPISTMNWGDTAYSVDARLVVDQEGRSCILMDLFTAKEADIKEINGAFMVPECYH
ncbi:MAG: helix-turn-helix transcriptional regulator [Clostridia bacterium]|nr:helix-turn-helix transcriptional regulator [Clostridia bacterium]